MKKRFTLEDVAKLAGVGKVTASYVLNGRGDEFRIKKETQQRVVAAAKELEYRPSAVARSLVSKRANAITVVFQYANYFKAGSSFVNELMRGVCEACIEADINLILHTRTCQSVDDEIHALMDGRSDGVLVLRDVNDPLLDELLRRQFPSVLFFTRPSGLEIPFIDSDNFEGGSIATQYLLDLGHRKIGFVGGSEQSAASSDRFDGYSHTLTKYDPSQQLLKFEIRTPDQVGDSFIAWCRQEKPTGLVCWSDDVAFSCIEKLNAAGVKIPDELAIVGFDSSEACNRIVPSLTSVRQPIYEMAREAARLLIAKTQQRTYEYRSVFPLTLDVRGSTQTPQISNLR